MVMYTRLGDAGTTSTLKGDRVPKDCCLIKAIGDLDELQTQIDKCISYLKKTLILEREVLRLERIQTLLWQLGGEISFEGINDYITNPIEDSDVKELENWIDDFNLTLKGFQRFENVIAIELNEARVRARRLERNVTENLRESKIRPISYKYLNRLSNFFFALSVYIERKK